MKDAKKILALVLAFVMAFVMLTGCSKKEEKEEKNTEVATFDYSYGLDETGYYTGVKALDYVKLGDISKISISAGDIQDEIDEMRNTKSYMKCEESTTRTIVNGDEVNIDYVGSIDGVEFDGGNTNGAGTTVTIGVTNYIDDFLEQLIGHKPGDTFDINVTFPEDYGQENLNGKDAVFKTTVNYVNVYTLNTVDDAFVAEYFADNGWTTVADMKQGICEYLAEDKVYEDAEFDTSNMPAIVGDQYVARMMYEVEQMAATYGLDADTYVSYMYSSYGITSADMLKAAYESYKDAAASQMMVYQAVAEAKGMKATDADFDAYIKANSLEEDKDGLIELYGKPYLMALVLYDKVAEYIHSVAVVE